MRIAVKTHRYREACARGYILRLWWAQNYSVAEHGGGFQKQDIGRAERRIEIRTMANHSLAHSTSELKQLPPPNLQETCKKPSLEVWG